MPNDMITLNTPIGRLQGQRRVLQTWVRLADLATPLGVSNDSTLRSVIHRNAAMFGKDVLDELPVQTEGGTQMVLHVTWEGALRLAWKLTTPKARKAQLWLVEVVIGERRATGRAIGDLLSQLDNPLLVVSDPMFQAGANAWRHAAAIEAEAKRQAKAERARAEKLWSNIGLKRTQAQKMMELIATVAPAAQPQLPFEGA